MKKIISAFAILALFASAALAQLAGVVNVGPLTGGTNVIAASTTNTPGSTFAVSEYDTVGIQITLKASNTNATAVTFYFSKTADSTTYETTPSLSCEITPNGTNEVSKFFALDVSGVAGLKLTHSANSNANGYVTNVAMLRRLKATKVLTR